MNNNQPLNKIGMKRLMKYILLMIVPSIYLAACSSSKEEVIEPSITISGNNSAIVSSKGENISFSFNSTFNWTASSNMSWCKITPANGIGGNATIQVTINENTSYDNREAVIRIVSEGISTAFNITQIQKDGILIAKDKYIVSGQNTTLEFKIDTNVEFNVTTPDWIKYNKDSRALASVPLQFTIEANNTDNEREGKIIITSGDIKQEINIVQPSLANLSKTIIVHTNQEYTIPNIIGNDVWGTIFWGDDKEEDYNVKLSHKYTDSTEHKVNIEVWNAEEIIIPKITNIKEIDLSEF